MGTKRAGPLEAEQAIWLLRTDIEAAAEKWQRIPARMRAALRRHHDAVETCLAAAGGVIQNLAGDGALAWFWPEGDPLGCALSIQHQLQGLDWSAIGGLDLRVGVHGGGAIAPAPSARLKRQYGLTPAEIRVAIELAGGAPPPAIAAGFGVKQATVRSQLKSIFFKLECHSQAELVAKLAKLMAADAGDIDHGAVHLLTCMTQSAWPGQIVVSASVAAGARLPEGARFEDLGRRLAGMETAVQLYGLHHPGDARAFFPPLRSAPAAARNVPAQATALIGREDEVAALMHLISECPAGLLTIVGAGGVGKTRLAGAVALLLAPQRAVNFVSLEHLTPGDDLAAQLGAALGFPFHGPSTHAEQLLNYLRARDEVLIFDGAEHVAAEADFMQRLARACPRVLLLATSREPLNVEGERLYPLGGLRADVGGDCMGAPAGVLFLSAARHANPQFSFAADDTACFGEICALLGGSPLGLQLAAQWVRYLPLAAIAARLRESGELLQRIDGEGGRRHDSFDEVFETTWTLLEPPTQRALAALSIFPAGFTLAAAEAIAGVDGPGLRRLELMGLAVSAGALRFRLHPLVLHYAGAKLAAAEGEALQARHSRYFLAFLADCLADPRLTRRTLMLEKIDAEFANIKQAWLWARSHGQELSVAGEHVFFVVAQRSLFRDGEVLFAPLGVHAPVEAYTAALLANCLVHQGKIAAARAVLAGAMDADPGPRAAAHAAQAFGNLAQLGGDPAGALGHYEEARALRSALGDDIGLSYTLAAAALALLQMDEVDAARPYVHEALLLSRKVGAVAGVLIAQGIAGDLALRAGDGAVAQRHYRAALSLEASAPNPQLRAGLLLRVGKLALQAQERAVALTQFEAAKAAAFETGDPSLAARAFSGIGETLLSGGELEPARGAFLWSLRESLRAGAQSYLAEALLGLARTAYEAGAKAQAHALAQALSQTNLGAAQSLYQKLRSDLGLCDAPGPVPALEVTARDIVAAAEGEGFVWD